MMGTSHAISGGAAWIALTSTSVPSLGIYPLDPVSVIAGSVICAGAALLPDADHHNATIAHSIPVAGRVAAGAIGTISGGHRKGMHSLLAVVGMFYLSTLLQSWYWDTATFFGVLALGPLSMIAACVCFGLKALKVTKSWPLAWLLGGFGSVVLTFANTSVTWLPLCVTVGFAVHLIGDMLTVQGVPLLWPLKPKWPALMNVPPLKYIFLPGGAFALPILGTAGSWREWLLCLPMGFYLLYGISNGILALLR